LRLTDLITDMGRRVSYYPQLRLLAGSTNAVLLLCQLMYWAGRQADPEGWTFKRARATEEDPEGRIDPANQSLEHETGLTYKEQLAARKLLRLRGLLQERYDRPTHQLYFKVNFVALQRAWEEVSGGQVTEGNEAVPQRAHGMFPKVTSLKGTYTDDSQITSKKAPAPSAPRPSQPPFGGTEQARMPSTPVEAMRHPDILLYHEVCGRIPGAGQYAVVIETIRYFRAAKAEKAVEYLRPFWLAWFGRRRRSDGKPYDPGSVTWLTEWALNGSIPPESGGTHGTHQQSNKKDTRLSPADLAAAKRINRRLGQAGLSQMQRGGLSEEEPAPRPS
jgi:hypothetical protein